MTLVELMVAILVLGIMAAIAAPSFRASMANSQLRATTGDLISAINTAKAQAVSLRINVVLAARNDDWGKGWDVTYDYPASVPVAQRTEQNQSFPKSGLVPVVEAGGAKSITFQPSGFVAGGEKQFGICHYKRSRTIAISQLGRVTNIPGDC